MKSLFKSAIKIIYCIILPLTMILVLTKTTQDWPEITGVQYWLVVMITIATCLNGIFYFAMMSNTRIIPKKLVPKLSTEKWKGIGIGLGIERTGTGILLVLPFIVLELSW
tara:strand:+ start:3866 stop:4195 length:330 start_codon:yes stop_codon:yes gene_type:complete